MKLKYLAMLATASIVSLGMVTACTDSNTDSKPGDSEVKEQVDPCAGKVDPCAGKVDPCAGK